VLPDEPWSPLPVSDHPRPSRCAHTPFKIPTLAGVNLLTDEENAEFAAEHTAFYARAANEKANAAKKSTIVPVDPCSTRDKRQSAVIDNRQATGLLVKFACLILSYFSAVSMSSLFMYLQTYFQLESTSV
jgi:hypothetical protein